MFAIDYALLGAVVGLLVAAVAFTALLSIVAGLLASFRALLVPPLEVLRQQG